MNIEQAAKEYAKGLYGTRSPIYAKYSTDDFTAGANAYKSHISERMKTLREEFFDECTFISDSKERKSKLNPDATFKWFSNKLLK